MADLDFKQLKGTAKVGQIDLTGATSGTHPADRNFVTTSIESSLFGLDMKNSVRAASTGNVNISSPGTNIFDTVTLANGESVLLKNQTNGAQNGIYVFNGAGSAMTRRTDANTSAKVTSQLAVSVAEGATNTKTTWRLSTPDPITLDTTVLTFELFSSSYYATPTFQNKEMVAAVTVNVGDVLCNTGMAATPAKNSFVEVEIGGVAYQVGDAVKTAQVYFSGDTGTTARPLNGIVAGDKLYKGQALIFNTDATDRVNYNYLV